MIAELLALLLLEPAFAAERHEVLAATHTVVLSDGQTLNGRVLQADENKVVLVLSDGTVLDLPAAAVREVVTAAQGAGTWGIDPNRSRYLYSPTAFSLGQGHGYVAQRALVITSAGVGLLDFLDVEAGTVIPALFTGTPVGVLGAKVGVPLSHQVRIGAGVQAFGVVDTAVGFGFANATYGTPDAHVTVAVGGAFNFTEPDFAVGLMTISAAKRLGPSVALLTENWLAYFPDPERQGPWGGPLFAVPSGGVRLFGKQFAVDLALVPIITGESDIPVVPLPWISFAWNWAPKS